MPPSDIRPFVVGVGISRTATVADVILVAEKAVALSGSPAEWIGAIATIASREHDPVVIALATHFQCGIRAFDAAVLEAETPRLKNPSDALFARIGCHGVAEAAALAAAGKEANLVVEKMTGHGVTVAIAM
jgi:cobalamin biosynthesis protein CbiG